MAAIKADLPVPGGRESDTRALPTFLYHSFLLTTCQDHL